MAMVTALTMKEVEEFIYANHNCLNSIEKDILRRLSNLYRNDVCKALWKLETSIEQEIIMNWTHFIYKAGIIDYMFEHEEAITEIVRVTGRFGSEKLNLKEFSYENLVKFAFLFSCKTVLGNIYQAIHELEKKEW